MRQQGRRRLSDGREVSVHDNDGLRKICGCPRRAWAKCGHAWHFAFCWDGKHYRFSLDRFTGKRIEGKTEAARLADQLRGRIRDGTFQRSVAHSPIAAAAVDARGLSFAAFAEVFVERYSKAREKASWDDDASMLRQVMAFPVSWPGATTLGEKPLAAVTEDDIEAFIRRVAATRTTATRTHYVQLLRTVSTWAVRRGYREKPFATTESDVIRRKKASKRNRRLEPGEEDKLLAAAGSHLQRVIVAALETCCRLGELLSLQWCDVSLGRGEIVLRASKTKTATDRVIPVSNRLRAVLEHVRHDPNGEPHGPMAYVFGDELGGRVKCVRRAWQTAVLKGARSNAGVGMETERRQEGHRKARARVAGALSNDQPAPSRSSARGRLQAAGSGVAASRGAADARPCEPRADEHVSQRHVARDAPVDARNRPPARRNGARRPATERVSRGIRKSLQARCKRGGHCAPGTLQGRRGLRR